MSDCFTLIDESEISRHSFSSVTTNSLPLLRSMANDGIDKRSSLVKNVVTTTKLLKVDEELLPVTVNDTDYENAWVCSPYTAVVTYSLEELRHLPSGAARRSLEAMIRVVGPLLKGGRINRVACVNNWLLSTNLYPVISTSLVKPILAMLCECFPAHAIVFRSVNRVTNEPLMTSLKDAGCLLAPSRQVYLFDGRRPTYMQRSNTRRDVRLLADGRHFAPTAHEEISDFCRVKDLYDLLYLHKYSCNNPQFTAKLISLWKRSNEIQLFGVSGHSGRLDGVVGTLKKNGVLTAPLVGYDTKQTQQRGLYRLLMAHVLKKAADERLLLNLSAGAASFKRLRGGQGVLEYSAIYCRHLPARQRLAWKSLATVLGKIGGPILRRYEL